ncbi:MAG: HD-GYP domain-containing protein [bacterium]
MRRIITLELVGLEELGCDLYDEKGKVLYKKGTKLNSEIQMRLSHTKVFKRDEEFLDPKDKRKSPQKENSNVQLQQTAATFPGKFANKEMYIETIKKLEPFSNDQNTEYKSVIDQKKKEALLQGVKEVLYNGLNSSTLNTRLCFGITETIINELYNKLNVISNINELRIHDQYTFTHALNVAIISALIGRELNYTENRIKDLTFCAFLHDIGKFNIPENILYKPDSLTKDEMEIIKEHSQKGYDLILNKFGLPEELARPALQHHERWEGQGYPAGLKGDQISEFSQIIAIADVYDALISEKVYRGAVSSIEAMRIMLTEESRSFNPDILNRFVYMAAIKKEQLV